MPWRIEFDQEVEPEPDKPDPPIQRILYFPHDRTRQGKDPRSIGEVRKGVRPDSFSKYRMGDYRVTAGIEDEDLPSVVVRIGNRKDVYR